MNCNIKCSCGCSVMLTDKNIAKFSAYSCPICGQTLNPAYIEKIRQCKILLDECKNVKRDSAASGGFADMTSPFHITFEL